MPIKSTIQLLTENSLKFFFVVKLQYFVDFTADVFAKLHTISEIRKLPFETLRLPIKLPIEILLRLPTNIHKNTLRESLSKCLMIMQNFVDLTIDLPTILPKNRPIDLRETLLLESLINSFWTKTNTLMPMQTLMQNFIKITSLMISKILFKDARKSCINIDFLQKVR